MKKILALTIFILLALAGVGWAALPATDNFTGANSDPINASNWTTMFGGYTILDNQAIGTAGIDNGAFWKTDSFNANQYAQIKILSYSYAGVSVRASGTSCYACYTLTSSSVRVAYHDAGGTDNTLADITGLTINTGDTLRLEVTGTSPPSFVVKINGTQVGTTTDPGNNLTSGSAGIFSYANCLIDDFEGGDLVSIVAPTVTTQAISSITALAATGNGTITSDGGDTITENGVCIGASANPTVAGTHFNPSPADVSGAFTAAITGLSPGTHYHVRAFATNSAGTGYGADVEFDTPVAVITGWATDLTPTIDTVVYSIGTTTALAHGCVTAACPQTITENGIVVSTSADPTTADAKFTDPVRTAKTLGYYGYGNYVCELTSLTANTLYHYRAFATVGGTTYYGLDQTFTTAAANPTVKDLFVDPDGLGGAPDDARSRAQCGETTPWASLTQANDKALAGDTVYLRAGTHSLYPFKTWGSWDNHQWPVATKLYHVTYKNKTGESPIVTSMTSVGTSGWTRVGATNKYYKQIGTSGANSQFRACSVDGLALQMMPDNTSQGTDSSLTGAGQFASTADDANNTTLYIWCWDGAAPSTHTKIEAGVAFTTIYFGAGAPFGTTYGTGQKNYIDFSGIAFEGGYYVVNIGTNYITFDNCKFRSFGGYIKGYGERIGDAGLFNSEHCSITNSEIYNSGGSAIDITGGDYYTITGNYIHDIAPNTTTGVINYFKCTTVGLDFSNNLIVGGTSPSITALEPVIYVGGLSLLATGIDYECVNSTFANNIILNSAMSIAFTFEGASGCKIYNNTIANCAFKNCYFGVGNGGGASTPAHTWENCEIKNNIFWGSTATNNHFINEGGFGLNSLASDYNLINNSPVLDYYISTVSRNWAYVQGTLSLETNSVIGSDPLFAIGTGTTATNYKIKTGSPAIGAGTNVGLTADYAGTTYTTNYPIGAWDLSATAPTVTTQAVSDISYTTATGNATITVNDGTISENGVAVSTSAGPTTADLHFNPSPADVSGAFTAPMTGLTPNTHYYARGFATNEAGTSYSAGDGVEFTTEQVLGGGTTLGLGLGGGNFRPRP